MKCTRRQFLRRAFWSTTALGIGGAAYTKLIEPHRVQVSHIHVVLPGLARALDGVTVAQITDLHRSSLVSRHYIEHCVATANRLAPDLIVFTGDTLTDDGSADPAALVSDTAACLGQAQARHGVYASLGNHDHWFDADLVTKLIERAGVPVLRNQSTTVNINGARLPLVGLGDLWTEGVDFQKAFAGVNDQPALVLMHNPDTFEHWPRSGAHLVLAGHTHGGQVNLPFFGAPVVPSRYGQKYAQGLFRSGDTVMYVNRGLGVLWPGVRLNCRPEISVFHLRSA